MQRLGTQCSTTGSAREAGIIISPASQQREMRLVLPPAPAAASGATRRKQETGTDDAS